MFGTINSILTKIDDLVWGVPLIVMILATGIFLTIRLKGIQVRKLILAFKYMFSNETAVLVWIGKFLCEKKQIL